MASDPALRPWLPPLPESTDTQRAEWRRTAVGLAAGAASDRIAERLRALEALAACPVAEAGELAVASLGDGLYAGPACDVLGRSGWSGAREHLEATLSHGESLVRFKAVSALGMLGDPAAIPAVKALFDTEGNTGVLRWAGIVLGELGGPSERAFLEGLETESALAREGIRIGLGLLDPAVQQIADREFERAVARLKAGDAGTIETVLDRWNDPLVGVAARALLIGLPNDAMVVVLESLGSGPDERRFAAADLLGLRAVEAARPGLEALLGGGDPALVLVAAASLGRLGDDVDVGLRRWLDDFGPQDRAAGARRAVLIELPVPDAVVRVLLDDPCAAVTPYAAELIRREPTGDRTRWLFDALAAEHARVDGTGAPRDPAANGDGVLTTALREGLVGEGRPRRALLPDDLAAGSEALERDGFGDPHVLAAHFLLLAAGGLEDLPGDVVEPWLTSRSPLLRFDAIRIRLASGTLPKGPEDADPTVRALVALGR
jgi:HEAT repeat protein